MSAQITLYDGSTAVEIRIAIAAGAEVQAQAEQLCDDLNAFVAMGDPFSVVASDSTSGDHIRVELESGWRPGDADWKLFSSAAGILYVRARSAAWLARAVARVSWDLGKRMWLPNSAFLVQPTYSTILVRLNIQKTHDVQDTGAFGTSGDFQYGPLKTNFPEWQRVNMVGPVAALASWHVWQMAIAALGPDGAGIWNNTDHYVDTGKRLQVYREDPPGTYIVCKDFAEWLKEQITDPARPKDSVSVTTSDSVNGWDSVIGFGRDDGDPNTYNETEINLFLAKKVAENFAADPRSEVQNAQVSMLAYGSTSHPADPTKTDPEGHPIRLPEGLHVVVTKGFLQGTEDWDSVHDSYRAISNPSQQFSGYWYMDVWTGNKDRPGVAPISREDVVADWWANDAPRVTDNYPLYVGGELGSGLCPTFLGALIWQGAWRERTGDLARLASDVVRNFLRTCFPTSAVRLAMRSFTARALWTQSGSFAPLLTEDLIHRMYDSLLIAIEASPTIEERARLNAFVKYTRFLELYRAVLAAEVETEHGLDIYDEFRAFLYNIRYEGLVNYRFWTEPSVDPFGADTDLANRYGGNVLSHIVLENNPENVPSTWKSGGIYFQDFTDGALRTVCVSGLANNDLYPFTIIGYPDDPFDGLVQPNPTASASPVLKRVGQPWYDRGDAVTMWVMTKPGQTSLDWWFRPWVSGAPGSDQTIEVIDGSKTVVASRTFTASERSSVWINWVATGLQEDTVYQLRINDPHKQGVQMCWWLDGDPNSSPNDISGTYLVSFRVLPAETQAVLTMSPQWFFYVPADATELGGVWTKKTGEIRDATGTRILDKDLQDLDSTLQPFHHVLAPAQKDTVMRAANAGGDLTLMTVPPYLALHPEELIVPSSAV